jgi:gliding motility-associated-like protein
MVFSHIQENFQDRYKVISILNILLHRRFFLPDQLMVKGVLILFFCLLSRKVHSQDSCERRPYIPVYLLSNPSFESYAAPCSSGFQNIPFWFTPTNEVPTGFLNACNNFFISDSIMIAYSFTNPNICLFPVVPQPIPDGHGVAAVSDFGYGGAIHVYPFRKSYVSTCLLSPLQKDSSYRLDFFVGFGNKGNRFLQVSNQLLIPEFSQTIEKFTLFGFSDCSSISTPIPIIGCLSRIGWIPLGSCTVSSDTGRWISASISFRPDQNIAAIALGPSCDTTYILHPDVYTYGSQQVSTQQFSYFLDKLQFYQSSSPNPVVSLLSGNSCSSSIVLQMQPAAFYTGSLLQWYRNDTAIIGEQSSTINITRKKYGEGAYRCRVQNDSVCLISDTLQVLWLPVPDTSFLGASDTTACTGDTLVLNGLSDSTYNYRWQNGSSQPSLSVAQSGTYFVSVSNQCGTAQANKTVRFEKCDFSLYVPNAFTPNGDGHNDIFKVHYHTLPDRFVMHIYNRNGAEIFYSSNADQGWDGSDNGSKQPSGSYVWVIEYNDNKHIDHTMKGTVTLIR